MLRIQPTLLLAVRATLVVFLLAGQGLVAKEPSIENKRRVFHQLVERRVETNLHRMQLSMRLNDEQTQLLRETAKAALKAWTNEQPPEVWFSVKGIPNPVMEAVMKKADRRLGIAVANRYRKDLEIEKTLHRAIGVDGVAVVLDQVVALNQRQDVQIRELISRNWKKEWLNRVLTSGAERINILRPALANLKPQLKDILDSRQYQILITKRPSSSRALLARMKPSEIDAATTKFHDTKKLELAGLVGVRVAEIQDLCALNPEQANALKQTGEKVSKEVANVLSGAFRELKVKGPEAASPEAWELISSNHFLLVEQNSDWQATIQRLLTTEQKKTLKKRMAQRRRQWSDSAIGGIAALLGQQHRFTSKQTKEFAEVLRREIDVQHVWSTNDHYRELAKIPAKKFEGIFSDEQFIAMSAMFDVKNKHQ